MRQEVRISVLPLAAETLTASRVPTVEKDKRAKTSQQYQHFYLPRLLSLAERLYGFVSGNSGQSMANRNSGAVRHAPGVGCIAHGVGRSALHTVPYTLHPLIKSRFPWAKSPSKFNPVIKIHWSTTPTWRPWKYPCYQYFFFASKALTLDGIFNQHWTEQSKPRGYV